jgi:hypothetical protein
MEFEAQLQAGQALGRSHHAMNASCGAGEETNPDYLVAQLLHF